MESVNTRKKTLEQWLNTTCDLRSMILQPILGDASFRRYYRVYHAQGSFIAMDAPPTQENCAPFVAIANALRTLGLKTPEIIAADFQRGFLLLSDFGEHTYLKILTPQNADNLYGSALTTLSIMQGCDHVEGMQIPLFTQQLMWQEWIGYKEWFLSKFLKLSLGAEQKELDHCFLHIIATVAAQPHVFMHRDYHSANLMHLPSNEVGLLDFQDAFIGPITYDLVSLLRDCYIDWPDEHVLRWALYYWQLLKERHFLQAVSAQEFLLWFDFMGLQRHLKTLLTFSRKQIRDQQPHYLKHVPRTLNYLLRVSERYAQLRSLHTHLKEIVQPTFKQEILTCVQ